MLFPHSQRIRKGLDCVGRKSTKENKNVYQISRESAGLTREAASEKLAFVSSDRIEKIESEKTLPHPEEILAMADCYKNASLCNYFCANECPIGQEYIPQIQITSLSQITLEMLSTLNLLQREKDRLIDIAVDGNISSDEMPDFLSIQKHLDQLSLAIEALKIWANQAAAESGEEEKEE